MFSWITRNPLITGLIALVLIAAVIAFFSYLDKGDQRQENQLINHGVTQERDASKTEVINRVEQAQDAVRNPTSNELNRVCEKYDRNC